MMIDSWEPPNLNATIPFSVTADLSKEDGEPGAGASLKVRVPHFETVPRSERRLLPHQERRGRRVDSSSANSG